ncbi:Mobile element protein [Arthrobacter rhombi]|uniref:Mobile element protein n=2 Tax=Arthrobacter rhombi TaxID=71253 RepID=A0A1R4FPQ2_9MICC|nr:Mobile element protein [Arthrobacter rhombi]
MAIGWSMADHMRASLCTSALRMARNNGQFAGLGTIFPSVRGAQYTSEKFQTWCSGNGIAQSLGAVGVCWDNFVTENFFSRLKTEFYC